MESHGLVNAPATAAGGVEETVAVLRELAAVLDALDEVAAERVGVGRGDLRVLEALSRTGGSSTPSLLAEQVRLSRPALSAALNRLETAGLVRREPNLADRRSVMVHITASATTRLGPLYEQIHQSSATVLDRLAPDDLALVGHLIAELVATLKTSIP